MRRLLVVCIAAILTLASAAAHPKISPDLERIILASQSQSSTASAAAPVNVIVQYKPGGLLRTIIGNITGLVRELPLIGALAFRISPEQTLTGKRGRFRLHIARSKRHSKARCG